ncbi:MAG: zf-HC2 domain-containing protein [Chloroflexi bacterium]|nr:zf-HC2 domain-containing protein [Chloroflexota bacterium]
MTLRPRHPDTHGHFRALISQRLDERLSTEDSRALRSHLLTCARCRAADRDYRAQRILLRAPSVAVPPRDLWARTSTALDREVTGSGRSGATHEPIELRGGTRRGAIASLVGLALVVAVVGSQLDGTDGGALKPSGVSAAPTPIEVPTQELAFVGHDDAGFAIYRTEVSMVCPERAVDCATVISRNREVVRLGGSANLKPSSVAFHPQRDKVAIAATVGRGESIYVVLLKPVGRSIDANATDAPRTSAPWTPVPTATFAVVPTSTSPSAIATAVPATPPHSTPRVDSPSPGTNPTRTPGSTGSPRASLLGPTIQPPTEAPTSQPTAAPPVAGVTPPVAGVTPSDALPADIQPILQDVLPAGAEPAWSPDGDTLAFSAMPADGSHGPDIYTWRAGAQKATRLTEDHRSYFASWAGGRIVASRAGQPGRLGAAVPRVTNIVIDLVTGEQRRIAAAGLWLPVVDPTERFAVVWRGELRQAGRVIQPAAGALYLADWRRLDPFRASAGTAPQVGEGARRPGYAEDESYPPSLPAVPAPTSTQSVASLPAVTPSAARRRTRPPATPTTPEPSPAATPQPTAPGTPEAADRQRPTDAAARAQAVEPGRDPRTDPVLEWLVRWNTDGDAYGFWIAETPGAEWGRLAIVGVDHVTGRIDRDETLLGPTLARRSFTIGQDRVAWVAPVDDQPDGELRVRTWGPNGNGTVRIRGLDGEGVPGF